MRVDPHRHVDAAHFRPELRIAEHALAGHDARAEDRLLVIDVVQERVERLHALAQPAIEHLPLVRRNDPRHDVERNQPLGAGILAVHRERDADAMKRALGLVALLGDPRPAVVRSSQPANAR